MVARRSNAATSMAHPLAPCHMHLAWARHHRGYACIHILRELVVDLVERVEVQYRLWRWPWCTTAPCDQRTPAAKTTSDGGGCKHIFPGTVSHTRLESWKVAIRFRSLEAAPARRTRATPVLRAHRCGQPTLRAAQEAETRQRHQWSLHNLSLQVTHALFFARQWRAGAECFSSLNWAGVLPCLWRQSALCSGCG